jgi:hypothetical protein
VRHLGPLGYGTSPLSWDDLYDDPSGSSTDNIKINQQFQLLNLYKRRVFSATGLGPEGLHASTARGIGSIVVRHAVPFFLWIRDMKKAALGRRLAASIG